MPTKVTTVAFDEFKLDLEEQKRRLEDLSPVTKVMADQFTTMTQLDVFKAEQSPHGVAWQELSDVTKNQRRGSHSKVRVSSKFGPRTAPSQNVRGPRGSSSKRKKKRGSRTEKPFRGKILQDTGKLKEATFAKGTDHDAIEFGVSGAPATYAPTHQFGKHFGTHEVPARPFLPVGKDGTPSFHAGPALKWATRLRNRVINWVLDGTLSDKEPQG